MKKKSKIVLSVVLAVIFASVTAISSFATSIAPVDGIPLGGFRDEVHYPQFNYNFTWWGNANTNNGPIPEFYATQYIGSSPVVYGDMQTMYDIGNGTNTLSRYGGQTSFMLKYLNGKNQSENALKWANLCYGVIPVSFGISAENTITPPHNSQNSVLKFPNFDFIFNPNGVIGDGNIVVTVDLRFRTYTYSEVGEFVTIEPFNLVIPSTAYNRYVGGDIGHQDQQCFSINMTDILLPILYENGWELSKGIYWEYINVEISDIAIPDINENSALDFVFFETVTYTYNDYKTEVLAYNGAVDTYQRQQGYNEGYQIGYDNGEYDGTATGFENGYKVGYNEGQNFLMIVPNFLEGVVEPFFSLEIFPNFSIGALLSVLVGAFVVLWILKLIAGG